MRQIFPNPMRKLFLQMIGCAVLVHLFSLQAAAQTRIFSVAIEGNVHVSEEKIERILRIKSGDAFDRQRIAEAMKRLYGTHEFADVQILKDEGASGVNLYVIVKEHIRVDEVRLEGNKKIKDEDLVDKMKATKGSFVRPALIADDFRLIEEQYRDKGYYRAKVTNSILAEQDDSTKRKRTVLVYKITEGEKVSIQHVDFFGNRSLDSDVLRSVMESKEDNWIRGGEYKPKALEGDHQTIVSLYREHGLLDARVINQELIFSDDGKELDVFLTIDEGKQYRVGDITWSGNTVFEDALVKRLITLQKGQVFNDSEFANVQFAMNELYWNRGYIYNSVSPKKSIRGDVIDLNFEITEGQPAHIRQISISGNTKTSERVIRRKLLVKPGEIFRRPALVRSLREVFNLGFFEGPPDVGTNPVEDGSGDIDVDLKVTEKRTGQFRLGAGFSALNSISGFFGLAETNFLGTGQQVSVDWEFSRFRQNVDLRYTEPWLFDSPTQLSLNVFNRTQNQVRQQFYDDRRLGASLSVGRPLPGVDFASIFWRYSWESIELRNFSSAYTGPLLNINWPQNTSSTAITVSRNSTDSPFHPSSGTSASFTAEVNGGKILGGDVRFQSYEASFSWFDRLFWRFLMEFSLRAGVLDGFTSGAEVPDYELFRLGGNRRYGLRGYDFFEVVPDGNPEFLGGRYNQVLKYEITFPIAPTVFGVGFFDAGNTWNSFKGADLLDLKKGLGLGIRIELPLIGTIGFDYGYGFDKIGGASWEPHISLGQGF